jgi:hypothetical protein
VDHGYRIEGNINGRSLLGLGAGKTDPATGVSEMEISFEKLPDGWDPRTIVLMCCDRAVVMAARETDGAVCMYRASGGYLTIGRDLVNGLRWGIMRDRDGLVMVDVRASSVTDFRHDSHYDHSRVEGGVSHLRRGVNGIANVRSFEGVTCKAAPGLLPARRGSSESQPMAVADASPYHCGGRRSPRCATEMPAWHRHHWHARIGDRCASGRIAQRATGTGAGAVRG